MLIAAYLASYLPPKHDLKTFTQLDKSKAPHKTNPQNIHPNTNTQTHTHVQTHTHAPLEVRRDAVPMSEAANVEPKAKPTPNPYPEPSRRSRWNLTPTLAITPTLALILEAFAVDRLLAIFQAILHNEKLLLPASPQEA